MGGTCPATSRSGQDVYKRQHIVSGIDSFAPGYIDRENEVIVGLQTDAPLKRIVNLYGGTRMARSALEQYGYRLDPEIEDHFSQYRKTHNRAVRVDDGDRVEGRVAHALIIANRQHDPEVARNAAQLLHCRIFLQRSREMVVFVVLFLAEVPVLKQLGRCV